MDIDEMCNELYDNLIEQEELIDKIYSDIDILWETVINNYLDNEYCDKILDQLEDKSYEKFFKFICNNSDILQSTYKNIRNINRELKELRPE